MRALRLVAPLRAVVTDVPDPAPGANEVLLRARCTALSTGTEIRQYRDERVAQNPSGFPRGNGYSFVGTIVALGAEVNNLQVGQRVFTTLPHDELAVVAADRLYAVPDSAADEQAAFTVICEVGLHALRRGHPSLGENVAIIGQGIIGLATLAIARSWGLRTIAIDRDLRRLAFARAVGAHLALSPDQPDFGEQIASFCDDAGIDLVVEAASSWQAIRIAYQIVRPRGTISVVARHTDVPDFNPIADDLMTKEVLFTTSYAHPVTDAPPDLLRWTRPRNLRLILELCASGQLDITPAISHHVRVEDLPAIYQRLHDGDTSIAGVVVDWR